MKKETSQKTHTKRNVKEGERELICLKMVVLDVQFPGMQNSGEELNQAKTIKFTSRFSQCLDGKFPRFPRIQKKSKFIHTIPTTSRSGEEMVFLKDLQYNQSLGDEKPHEPRCDVEPRRDVEMWRQDEMWRRNASGRPLLPRFKTLEFSSFCNQLRLTPNWPKHKVRLVPGPLDDFDQN